MTPLTVNAHFEVEKGAIATLSRDKWLSVHITSAVGGTIFDLAGQLWKSELARIRAAVLPNSSLRFTLSGDIDWNDDQIAGGVVAPAFWCPLETEKPVEGCVPPTLTGTVVASQRLRADCSEIGEDFVFSDRLLRALQVSGIAFLPVSVKDITDTQPWRKLLLSETDFQPLLDDRWFAAAGACAVCGRPWRSTRGVWVIREHTNLSDERAGFDQTAYGHDLGRHACVIGPGGIRGLQRRLGSRSFLGEPVLGRGPLLEAMVSLQAALDIR